MRKKLVVTLLAASMMGSMLAGCGGGTSGEEGKESSKKGDTIKVMCVGTEAETYIDAYNSIAEKFSENNEYGVDVEIEYRAKAEIREMSMEPYSGQRHDR